MKKTKLRQLGRKANNHLRIDYSKYEVDDAVATVAEALILPLYVGRSLIVPMLGFLALYIMLAFAAYSNGFQLLVYPPIAWILSLPLAILLGGLLLLRRIGQDLTTVFSCALDTSRKVYHDTLALRHKARSEGLKASFHHVFQGVAFMIVLPSVHKVFERKLPLFGWLLAGVVDWVFVRLMKSRRNDLENIDNGGKDGMSSTEGPSPTDEIDKLKQGASETIAWFIRVLSLPVVFVSASIGLLTFMIQWLWYHLIFW